MHHRSSALLGSLLAVIVVALALAPARAQAGCGDVQRRQATKRLAPNHAPLIIGDSVLLGALGDVQREGFEINTRGCRFWAEGMRVLYARRHTGTLPHLVVVQLGTDGSVSDADLRYALSITGHKRVLVLMTPREAFGIGSADARRMRRFAAAHPRNVVALDWAAHSRGHPDWLAPDGIHLTYKGAAAFGRFLREVTRYARSMVLGPSAG